MIAHPRQPVETIAVRAKAVLGLSLGPPNDDTRHCVCQTVLTPDLKLVTPDRGLDRRPCRRNSFPLVRSGGFIEAQLGQEKSPSRVVPPGVHRDRLPSRVQPCNHFQPCSLVGGLLSKAPSGGDVILIRCKEPTTVTLSNDLREGRARLVYALSVKPVYTRENYLFALAVLLFMSTT